MARAARRFSIRVGLALAMGASCVALATAACGSGSSPPSPESQLGRACLCPGADATPGDWMCTTTSGPCSGGGNFCLNGICTYACTLDEAGLSDACPSGATCKKTTRSNLAVYCAPN